MTLRRRAATVVALAVALSACDLTLDLPSSSIKSASPSASASAAVSAGPFRPAAYPADGDAPCADRAAYTGTLKRIRAADEHSAVFELCGPDAAFRSRIATPALAIEDSAWLQSRIENGTILGEANGTGPYRLDRWSRGSEIILARNPSYWGNEPKPGNVVVVWDALAANRLARLQAGAVDGMDEVGPSDVPTVDANPDLVLLPRVGLNTVYLGMNSKFAPFDDVKVRQAIGIGLDRAALATAAFPPGSEVASHFTPCSIPYGCTGAPWPETDPSAARDLLEAAGYPTGFRTTITYARIGREYLPDPAGLAEAIRSGLAGIGIDAEVQVETADPFLEDVDAGRIEGLFLLGTQARFPDVTEFLDRNFGPNTVARFGGRSRTIAAALNRAAATLDDRTRTAAYTEVNAEIRGQVPMVPLAHVGSNVASRADVVGLIASPLGTERFDAVTPGDRGQFAWDQADEPMSLYCADEVDVASLRVCAQIGESLYVSSAADASVAPSLAESCDPDKSLTIWTCTLRPGVLFHDGSHLDAGDVLLSFAVQWDAQNSLHLGREGSFRSFLDRFKGFLNPPPG